MQLNAEQIKKALECCQKKNPLYCLKCPVYSISESCQTILAQHSLSLINELTEENEAWQKSLITQKENADKAYYELACEVENLRAENERLKEHNITLEQKLMLFGIGDVYVFKTKVKGE
jgi:hypothetical protein